MGGNKCSLIGRQREETVFISLLFVGVFTRHRIRLLYTRRRVVILEIKGIPSPVRSLSLLERRFPRRSEGNKDKMYYTLMLLHLLKRKYFFGVLCVL